MDVDPKVKRKRNRRQRTVVYGSLLAMLWGFWVWQPWEFDFVPREMPHPNPKVDPASARLFSKGTRVLIVTAHPDDSEFYVGGTLSKLRDSGAVIRQVIVTEGDKAYYGPFTNVSENRRIRHQEALEAARAWRGQDLIFLGFSDGRLKAGDRLVQRLQVEIEKFKPEYVLSFDYDYPPRMSHGDHRQTGKAVALAMDKATGVRWYMRFSTIAPNFIVDISDYWDQKKELLKIHKSQFHGDRLVNVTNMVEDSAMIDGERIGVTYGEGFRAMAINP
ncbi:MAG: PIG-L family deacetylase [Fimbriimonadaceae bacterium]|nr:PIG-L family deacetylase [Fimbriimonadaceae bacterium]